MHKDKEISLVNETIEDNCVVSETMVTQSTTSETTTTTITKSTTDIITTKETTTQSTKETDVEVDVVETEDYEEYIEPIVETTTKNIKVETEPVVEDSEYDVEYNETYYGSFEATWYEGGTGTYGYSGRDLISGYSVASNYFAQGTTLRIVGNGLDGTYRVDDRGGMADNVVDFYYQYGDVPSDFRYHGRVNIEVYVIE